MKNYLSCVNAAIKCDLMRRRRWGLDPQVNVGSSRSMGRGVEVDYVRKLGRYHRLPGRCHFDRGGRASGGDRAPAHKALVGGFPTLAPRRISWWLPFPLFLSSHGQMSVKGFYTIMRGSVVRGFDTVNDPQVARWYLCVVARPECTERAWNAPSFSGRYLTRECISV